MSSKKKKTSLLGEELAELLNPTPKDFDPEDVHVHEDTRARFDEFDDDVEGGAGASSSKLRRMQGIDHEDPTFLTGRYAGSKVSRKQAFADDEEDEDEVEDEAEGDEEESEEEDEEESEEEDQEDEDGFDMDELDDELNEIAQEQQRIPKRDSKTSSSSMKILSAAASAPELDLEKARHAQNQKALYHSFLKLRIHMQRSLVVANRAPQSDVMPAFKESSPQVKDALQSAVSKTRALLSNLLDLQKSLFPQRPEPESSSVSMPKASSSSSLPSDLDKVWERIEQQQMPVSTYRDAVLETTNRRVQVASGAAASQQFKAFNLSVVAQVNNMMRDSDRMIQKTQIKRFEGAILGKRARDDEHRNGEHAAKTPDDQAEEDSEPALKRQDIDEEIYDDLDFYESLIKELLDEASGDVDADTLGAAGRRRHQAVKKRYEDRHGSKGRRIQYKVHEKLVNFTVPVPFQYPPMATDLFAGLFGRKPTAST